MLEASPPHWREIWYAFLVTGLRKSELAGLQFTGEFLDWDAREIIIPPWLAKNGVQRRIPMDDRRRVVKSHETFTARATGRSAATPEPLAGIFPMGYELDPETQRETIRFYLDRVDPYLGSPMLIRL